jgi:hypothetical protein
MDSPATGSIKYRPKPPLPAAVDSRGPQRRVPVSAAKCLTAVITSALRKRSPGSAFFAPRMFFVFCEIFVIDFLATILFLAIHHYERNGPLAVLCKCLVITVGGVAILNKLQPLLGLNWI